MKQYNFDEIIERRGTNCVKFDNLKERFGNENLVPLWVADMDFRTPDFIVNAIKKRCEHEIFGYTYDSDSYYNSIIEWVHHKHDCCSYLNPPLFRQGFLNETVDLCL